MADNLPASLLVFISNLLVIYQLNVFIILLTNLSYARERQLCLDYVSSSSRLVMRRPRLWRQQRRPRRFWIKPGRTQSWWDSFSNNIVPPEEWRDNFRMSRASFFSLCDTATFCSTTVNQNAISCGRRVIRPYGLLPGFFLASLLGSTLGRHH